MPQFLVLNGQSNLDLCLKSVGGLDSYIKYLNDNNLSNSLQLPISVTYNSNSTLNKLIAGKNYSTGTANPPILVGLLDNDSVPLLDNDGTPLFDND